MTTLPMRKQIAHVGTCDNALGWVTRPWRIFTRSGCSGVLPAGGAVLTADANATTRGKATYARKDVAAHKNDAGYAAAREKCDALAHEAKDNCMKDAKARFGKT